MDPVDPSAGSDDGPDEPSPFRIKCKEAALQKMKAMTQLANARQGEMKIANLIPVARVMQTIVENDKSSYYIARRELKSFIAERNKVVSLQDLPGIAAINFLEGFESFIKFIHTSNTAELEKELEGEAEGESGEEWDAETITLSSDSSNRNTPEIQNVKPKRRPSKRLDNTREKEDPVRKSARCVKREMQMVEDEEDRNEIEGKEVMKDDQMKCIRKSAVQYEVVQFSCVFNGCADEFDSVKALKAHAEECAHKGNMVLVFGCSMCKKGFSTVKKIKIHISHQRSKCAGARINIGSMENQGSKVTRRKSATSSKQNENPSVKSGDENEENVVVRQGSMVTRRKSATTSKQNENPSAKSGDENEENVVVRQGSMVTRRKSATSSKQNENPSAKSGDEYEENVVVRQDSKVARRESVINSEGRGSGGNIQPQVFECLARGCSYTGTKVENLYAHIKHTHSGYTTTFTCLRCDEEKLSGKGIANHIAKVCVGAEIYVKLSENEDQKEANDVDLSIECPIKNCGVSISTVELASHFKSSHPESTVSFQCSKCSLSDESYEEMMDHCESEKMLKCTGSIPEIIVDGQVITKKTAKRMARQSVAARSVVKREAGRSLERPAKKRGRNGGAETEDEEDIPNLEMNEDGDTMDSDEGDKMDEGDTSIDGVSIGENKTNVNVKKEMNEEDGNQVYRRMAMSDSEDSSAL